MIQLLKMDDLKNQWDRTSHPHGVVRHPAIYYVVEAIATQIRNKTSFTYIIKSIDFNHIHTVIEHMALIKVGNCRLETGTLPKVVAANALRGNAQLRKRFKISLKQLEESNLR